MTLATVTPIVAPRPRPVTSSLGGIHCDVDEMTVVYHSNRPVPFGTRRAAGEMIAGRHRRLHLALAETTISVIMTAGAGMAEIVGNPRSGIVAAATLSRSRGLRLVDATSVNANASVPRLVERADETGIGTVLVITNAEGMIHGTDTCLKHVHSCIYENHAYSTVERPSVGCIYKTRSVPRVYYLAIRSAVDHLRAFHWHGIIYDLHSLRVITHASSQSK
jgi:hypothetical protein